MRGRTNILSDGGTAVANGELKEFVVADGREVKVGDFVQVIYQENKNENIFDNYQDKKFVQIDETRGICLYKIGLSSGSYYRASIFAFENNSFVIKSTITLSFNNWELGNGFVLKETSEHIYVCFTEKGTGACVIQASKDKKNYKLTYQIFNANFNLENNEIAGRYFGGYKFSENTLFFVMLSKEKNESIEDTNFRQERFHVCKALCEIVELSGFDDPSFNILSESYEKFTNYTGNGQPLKRSTEFVLTKINGNELEIRGVMNFEDGYNSLVSVSAKNITGNDFEILQNSETIMGNKTVESIFSLDANNDVCAYGTSQNRFRLIEGGYEITSFSFMSSGIYYNVKKNIVIAIKHHSISPKKFNFQIIRFDDSMEIYYTSDILETSFDSEESEKEIGFFKINDSSFALFYGKGYYTVTYKNNQLQSGQDMLVNMVEPFNGDYSAIGFSKTGGAEGQTVKVYVPWENSET